MGSFTATYGAFLEGVNCIADSHRSSSLRVSRPTLDCRSKAPVLSTVAVRQAHSFQQNTLYSSFAALIVRMQPCGAGGQFRARQRAAVCRASSADEAVAARSRQVQVDATKLLAELLQAKELEAAVQRRVGDLSEDFFHVASAYLEMAKKEGNPEVVRQLEAVLKAAMAEKEKTLRPEIRLLNQLLREKTASERVKTLAANEEHLVSGGYFFNLLNRMIVDVEAQKPPQTKLLTQLRTISREAKEASRGVRRVAKDGGESGGERDEE